MESGAFPQLEAPVVLGIRSTRRVLTTLQKNHTNRVALKTMTDAHVSPRYRAPTRATARILSPLPKAPTLNEVSTVASPELPQPEKKRRHGAVERTGDLPLPEAPPPQTPPRAVAADRHVRRGPIAPITPQSGAKGRGGRRAARKDGHTPAKKVPPPRTPRSVTRSLLLEMGVDGTANDRDTLVINSPLSLSKTFAPITPPKPECQETVRPWRRIDVLPKSQSQAVPHSFAAPSLPPPPPPQSHPPSQRLCPPPPMQAQNPPVRVPPPPHIVERLEASREMIEIHIGIALSLHQALDDEFWHLAIQSPVGLELRTAYALRRYDEFAWNMILRSMWWVYYIRPRLQLEQMHRRGLIEMSLDRHMLHTIENFMRHLPSPSSAVGNTPSWLEGIGSDEEPYSREEQYLIDNSDESDCGSDNHSTPESRTPRHSFFFAETPRPCEDEFLNVCEE